MRKIFSILILTIFLTTSINYGLIVDDPQYRVDKIIPDEKSPNIIHPGDDVDLWFKITNNNNRNVKDIIITITPHYPFEVKQVNPIKGTATLSHLNTGESDTVYFKLHVNEDAPSQNYRIDVNIVATEYEEKKEEVYENKINFTKIYYLPIYGIAKFEIDTNNGNNITPSETKDIDIILKNKGTGIAKYLTLNLKGTENVNIVGPATFYLKSVKPGENSKISAKIYALTKADDGIYPITAIMYWTGEDGTIYNSTIPINIKVVKVIHNNSVFVYLDGYKYNPDASEIVIGVANRGSTTIKHCVLKISGITELNNNYIKYIGDLNEDDYDTVSYNVYGKLNETQPVKVDLTYFDDYHNEYHISKTFNITFKEHTKVKSSVNYYYMIIGLLILIIVWYIYKKRKKKEMDEYEE